MKQRVLSPCAGSIASRQTHLTGCSGCCLSVLYTGGLSKKHANPLSPRNPEERVGKNSCSFGRGEGLWAEHVVPGFFPGGFKAPTLFQPLNKHRERCCQLSLRLPWRSSGPETALCAGSPLQEAEILESFRVAMGLDFIPSSSSSKVLCKHLRLEQPLPGVIQGRWDGGRAGMSLGEQRCCKKICCCKKDRGKRRGGKL